MQLKPVFTVNQAKLVSIYNFKPFDYRKCSATTAEVVVNSDPSRLSVSYDFTLSSSSYLRGALSWGFNFVFGVGTGGSKTSGKRAAQINADR